MGPDFRPPEGVRIACIGPVTVRAARKAGLSVDILQERYTVPDLVEAIVTHFGQAPPGDGQG
jgi:uroporphyrinogen III methyltransferase/synthase